MNVGDISNGGVSSSKQLKHRALENVSSKKARPAVRPELQDDKQEPQDSVAISEEARRALAENQKKLLELEQARQALDEIPEMSDERKREIQERIDSAYYSKPEIIDKIASRIARDLGEFKRPGL